LSWYAAARPALAGIGIGSGAIQEAHIDERRRRLRPCFAATFGRLST
jgi:hypothetical protein